MVFFLLFFVQELEQIRSLKDSPEEALVLAQKVWENSTHPERLEAGLEMVYLLRILGRFNECQHQSERLLTIDTPHLIQVRVLKQVAHLIKDRKDRELLPFLFEHFQRLKIDMTPEPNSGQLCSAIGVTLLSLGKFLESELYFKYALEFTPQGSSELISINSNLGVSFAQQGKLHEGLEHFIIASELFKEANGKENLSHLQNIGGIMIYLEKWEESLKYSYRALELLGDEPSRLRGSILNNIGTANLNLKKFDLAFQNFQESLNMAVQLGYEDMTAANNMGFLLVDQAEFKRALKYLLVVEDHHKANKSYELLAIVQKNIGQSYQGLKQLEKASTYFQSAYEIYKEYDLRQNRLELYPVYIENCVRQNQYKQAFFLMQEFKELNDETVKLAAKVEVEGLLADWDMERKEKDLQVAQLEQEKQAKIISELKYDNQLQNQIRLFLIVGLFAALAMILLLVRSLRFRKRAHLVLSEKNVKIEQQNMDLDNLNKKLELQSFEDVLTGLNNRRYFDFIMESEVKKMARAIKNHNASPMLIILADLDHFKKINDNFGHPMGDKVLQLFADCLKEVARDSDILVRWGGEEFLWLCRDASFGDGPRLCDRLSKLLALRSQEKNLIEQPITVSMGFAEFPFLPSTLEVSQTLKVADLALYRAKRSGRNGWVGYQNQAEESKGTSEDFEQSEAQGLFGLNASTNLTIK